MLRKGVLWGKSSVAIFRQIILKPDLKMENREERKSIWRKNLLVDNLFFSSDFFFNVLLLNIKQSILEIEFKKSQTCTSEMNDSFALKGISYIPLKCLLLLSAVSPVDMPFLSTPALSGIKTVKTILVGLIFSIQVEESLTGYHQLMLTVRVT